MKPLILIELNEINFDIVKRYIDAGARLPNFAALIARKPVRCTSEQTYELLEPWIQWVSVHTGLTYAEHRVFRLGDMVASSSDQLFEILEREGVSVGAVSPMNAANRLLRPAYFIPDPWTKTPSDPSTMSRALAAALAQTVKDNAQAKISPFSIAALLLALACCAPLRHYWRYARLFAGAVRKRWQRAMFLDLLLHDVHRTLFVKHQPGFSALFLNAGAHIQHHYMLNSTALPQPPVSRNPTWYLPADADPLAELLALYDAMLGEIIHDNRVDYLIATGLTQIPHDQVKFYYRLKDHARFLDALGIVCRTVHARMTRDFLIEFECKESARRAELVLSSVVVSGSNLRIFGKIDNRGESLFVTLTYPKEIDETTTVVFSGGCMRLHDFVVFVAIKNGMHDVTCFVCASEGLTPVLPSEGAHVKEIFSTIRRHFGVGVKQ